MAANRITISQTQRLALNGQLLTSLKVLRFDASGLSRYLEEQARANPALQLDWPVQKEWLPRWHSAFAGPAPPVEEVANAAPGLYAHVMGQLGTLRLSARDRAFAETLIGALEPSGWLGQPLGDLAQAAGFPQDQAEALLARLQRLDPPGLFARSLAECLRVQAEDAGLISHGLLQLLDRLPMLATGDLARVGRQLHMPEAEVGRLLRVLRSLDPKPGARFAMAAAPVREPDLVATRSAEGDWQVELNRSALPTLSIAGTDGSGRAAAQALIRLVEGRNATLLRVARDILSRQGAALDDGLGALVPLTMTTVAESLGLAQSTISRVVAGVAVDTPRGTWWLRSLFGGAVGDAQTSGAALRERMRQLIRAEDPANPLTDDALAAALADEGMALSRRTVAKYRELLSLPTAQHRRRRPQKPAPHRKPDRKGRPEG